MLKKNLNMFKNLMWWFSNLSFLHVSSLYTEYFLNLISRIFMKLLSKKKMLLTLVNAEKKF